MTIDITKSQNNVFVLSEPQERNQNFFTAEEVFSSECGQNLIVLNLTPSPSALAAPYFCEQRRSDRCAAPDVQDGRQGRVNSGQNANRVGAFVPEGVTV